MEPAQQPQHGSREAPAPVIGKGERPGNSGQAALGTESGNGGGPSPLEGGKGTAAVATAAAATTFGAGGQQRRRKRGAVAAGPGCGAPLALAANGTQAAAAAAVAPGGGSNSGANSLLLRRGRLKRNLSAAASSSSSSAAPAAASLGTRSLDRKALLLLPKPPRQLQPLQPPERDWVRRDLQRGCVHVYYYYYHHHHHHHQQRGGGGGGGGYYLRPVLCTLETTAAEVASRLLQLGHRGGGSNAVRVLGKVAAAEAAAETRLPHEEEEEEGLATEATIAPGGTEEALANPVAASASPAGSLTPIPAGRRPRGRRGIQNGLAGGEAARPGLLALSSGESGRAGGRHSLSPADCSPGRAVPLPPPPTELYLSGPPLSCPSLLGGSDTESFSPSAESASDRLDPYSGGGGSTSSSEELEADPVSPVAEEEETESVSGRNQRHRPGDLPAVHPADPWLGRAAGESPGKGKALGVDSASPQQPPALYVQLHGETARRLESHEKPLQIQNDYLSQLGFRDLWRVQEEGMDSETGCLIRFYAGKPHSVGNSERIQLSGMYNVRKGKMHLPVNRWTRRQVILCGTCLIVSSVKESQTGKMHVLPLIGGKVEEVKKHQHCLAFSSSGPQSQSYYICFDTFTEYLRWLRQASKIASQRISSVDLSCCSLEDLPANLFYSQDLTHLNLKQNFLRLNPSSSIARGPNELQRFSKLRSLNLSNNHLGDFPLAVCSIPTLTELNVSCNALRTIPAAIGEMNNLQTFLLDGNFLQSLPTELERMHQLSYLGLSFNEFSNIPEVLEKLPAMDKLCMSGNCMEMLSLQTLKRLPHIKHIDLRLNVIRRLVADEVDFLHHVTQLDLRDNKLGELDATVFNNVEILHCERNQLVTLKISGYLLKALYATSNELVHLDVYPVPNYLTYMDVSRNHLESLPDWVCDSRKLEVLDIGHNQIRELPARLFCNISLRKLLAGHNQLARLPERIERTHVEFLDMQHNLLTELPSNLLLKADSLRYLNASANKLEMLPPATLSEETHSILQELYLTNNHLTDKCVPLLTGHLHLKILHMAYNRLQSFPASKMAKLEELEEIDVSGNKLKSIPTTIMNCRRMHTVIAHSNCIEVFPEVMQLTEIKCVDLSCNELTEVMLPENLPPKLQELDLTGNPRLVLDHKTLELLNNIRCFKIDQPSAGDASGAPAVWSHGYTEASGVKNKLCVAALSANNFCDNREALYGVFDGDRNVEVPYLLQCTMSDILAEELQKTKSEEEYMINTFIVMQRKLGTAGQKLGGSAVLCHIKHDPIDPGGCFTLTSANVGKCQSVLCRNGKPLPLSRSYMMSCEEELKRIKQHKAIITEDGKVNGVTDSTRILGYSFLHPSVVPRPHVQSITLTPQDEFFILGSKGLWDSLSIDEAVEAVRNVPDALGAAKKLCTLAQSYGCNDSLSAVVVQLNVTEDSFCCCELNGIPPPSPGIFPQSVNVVIKDKPSDALGMPSSSSGMASEISSEISTSEMSSEVGSTASDDPPQVTMNENSPAYPSEQRCMLHPVCLSSSFQRQLSSATFSSAFSDNGLDSDDEEPIEGVFSNGSRVEVEVDIHCGRAKEKQLLLQAPVEASDEGIVISANEDEACLLRKVDPSAMGTIGRRRGNGSVAPQERSHNLIEVAADAPLRKTGGYFAAPAQPDPDDQFIIPPELEEEVKEIMKQHHEQQQQQQQQHQQRQYQMDQLPDYYDTPL
ncbi:PH domain leucine-rich repeat-containing protein phosphatase 1 [Hemicordylus capensis]|uniref:PH domain leucine-rich repeat-containing protein phosphatase 1 n=1 Tax=Hemicordylus capensis TaxID=884348 RepID=UPI002302E68B|nr:PH domain leucine-rich repeat-containing protein phosphatase 1 [Hemicordylus capensis]